MFQFQCLFFLFICTSKIEPTLLLHSCKKGARGHSIARNAVDDSLNLGAWELALQGADQAVCPRMVDGSHGGEACDQGGAQAEDS